MRKPCKKKAQTWTKRAKSKGGAACVFTDRSASVSGTESENKIFPAPALRTNL